MKTAVLKLEEAEVEAVINRADGTVERLRLVDGHWIPIEEEDDGDDNQSD